MSLWSSIIISRNNEYKWLFFVSLILHYTYLGIILWSILFPRKRIWPPLEKWSWKYILSWGLFTGAVVSDIILMLTDRNIFLPFRIERLYLAIPLILIGFLFLIWGVRTLGIERTSGAAGEFITTGPYKFTRNPQYIGDIFLFIGLIVISSSLKAIVGLSLLIVAFLLMPLSEEMWLEEEFGEKYRKYKVNTPRFL